MPENNLSFDQLNDQAKNNAVTDFGRFYVKHLRTDGLDVFAQLDHSGYIADINEYMMENTALHSDELLSSVIRQRRGNLEGLIQQMGLQFNDEGKAQPELEQWYLNEKSATAVQ
ncbi:hypothetical protein [Lacticaseibacillus songhuajiangensis]|jgi:hypothetical protein|uniref:hypothetical protein n=1 Tax=Lacticaseibacillus songhuajiangensis TaxID=1296539 RepID=UPI000F7A79D8|nr:hypothetical protein [Lacticaseibacillus songhuajiangensis]